MSTVDLKDLNSIERRNYLLTTLKDRMPLLEDLLASMQDHWVGEDSVYRYYHRSYRVYRLQDATAEIVSVLQSIIPEQKLTEFFMIIIKEGTGKSFNRKSNQRWMKETRPIIEAFFHAMYFLEMAVKYGKELDINNNVHPVSIEEKFAACGLPSGWAALLSLYEML